MEHSVITVASVIGLFSYLLTLLVGEATERVPPLPSILLTAVMLVIDPYIKFESLSDALVKITSTIVFSILFHYAFVKIYRPEDQSIGKKMRIRNKAKPPEEPKVEGKAAKEIDDPTYSAFH